MAIRPDAVYNESGFLFNVCLYNDVIPDDPDRPPAFGAGVTSIVHQPASDPIIRAKREGAVLREIDTMEQWARKRLREP